MLSRSIGSDGCATVQGLTPHDSFRSWSVLFWAWTAWRFFMERFDFHMERFPVRYGAYVRLTASFRKFTAAFSRPTTSSSPILHFTLYILHSSVSSRLFITRQGGQSAARANNVASPLLPIKDHVTFGPKVTLPFPKRSRYLSPKGHATFPPKVRLPLWQGSGDLSLEGQATFQERLQVTPPQNQNPS